LKYDESQVIIILDMLCASMEHWTNREIGCTYIVTQQGKTTSPSSRRSACIHINSVVASATNLYSASMLEHETVGCFLEFQQDCHHETQHARHLLGIVELSEYVVALDSNMLVAQMLLNYSDF
jgi:hypothetical protein